MLHLIGYIMSGLVVGFVARALNPEDEVMILPKTIGLGVVGAILAGWLGGYFASLLGAGLILTAYYFVSRQRRLV
jgi:uncharacterized membrane protein YeaQ/YmgE (transglycosylase-associated protein family)